MATHQIFKTENGPEQYSAIAKTKEEGIQLLLRRHLARLMDILGDTMTGEDFERHRNSFLERINAMKHSTFVG